MSAIFVTATGTDIGKTFVTSGLLRALRAKGSPAQALKPVVSGFSDPTAAVSDSGVLLDAMGDGVTPQSLDRVSPWRFAAPLSPDMAAVREGRAIDFDALVQFCMNGIGRASGPLLIEGVGGVMVPLDNDRTVLDWMKAIDVPVLLVTGGYLGTISHTLTSCDVLARAGLRLRAIALNDSGDGAVPLQDTEATLRRFVHDVPIVTIPRVKSWLDAHDAFDTLARQLFEVR
jgi:dethiobiotin synthetase